MTEFQAKAVVDSINRMFKADHFSICTVDDCMKITGATKTADYDALRLYHCVHFSKMDKQTKEFVFRVSLENVCNCDAFPAVRLIERSDEIAGEISKSAIECNRVPLLKRLFG